MVIFEFLESDLEIVRVSDMIGGRLDKKMAFNRTTGRSVNL